MKRGLPFYSLLLHTITVAPLCLHTQGHLPHLQLNASVQEGQNVNAYHYFHRCNALHAAAEFGRIDQIKTLIDGKLGEDDGLVKSPEGRLDPNLRDLVHGNTALHFAVREERLSIVKMLLQEANADKTICNNQNVIPLQLAKARGFTEIEELLKDPPLAPINLAPYTPPLEGEPLLPKGVKAREPFPPEIHPYSATVCWDLAPMDDTKARITMYYVKLWRTSEFNAIRFAEEVPNDASLEDGDSDVLKSITITPDTYVPISADIVEYTVSVDCANRFEICKLHPATKYSCKLRADSAAGKSPWSEDLSFDTLGTAPSAPSSLQLFSTTSNSLTIIYETPETDNGTTATIVLNNAQFHY
jgi:hypothetical protein